MYTQNQAVPLTLIRDAYEGIILAAFFYLLLQYLAPTPAEQKEYFRTYKLKRWAWPFGGVKTKPVSFDDNPHPWRLMVFRTASTSSNS